MYTLFTSLLDTGAVPCADPLSEGALDSKIDEVVSSSVIRLETILRLYYLRHSYSFQDCFLNYHLSLLARITLEAMSTASGRLPDRNRLKSLRSTVILCIKGINEQGRNDHVAIIIYRLLRDSLVADDLEILKAHVTLFESVEDDAFVARHCRSQWPLPLIKVNGNPRAAGLDNLVKQYERFSVEDMTNANASSPGVSPEPESPPGCSSEM